MNILVDGVDRELEEGVAIRIGWQVLLTAGGAERNVVLIHGSGVLGMQFAQEEVARDTQHLTR